MWSRTLPMLIVPRLVSRKPSRRTWRSRTPPPTLGRAATRTVRAPRDRVHGDALVAELGAPGEHLQGVDDGGVAAPVDPEGVHRARRRSRGGTSGCRRRGRRRSPASGRRSAPAGRVAEKASLEHRPLHRVGVLELVDEDHVPARPHPLGRAEPSGLHRLREPGQHVVEGEDARLGACARRPRRARRSANDDQRPCLGPRATPGGRMRACGFSTRGAAALRAARKPTAGRRRARRSARGSGRRRPRRRAPQMSSRSSSRGVGVAGDAERAQHRVAELVGGRDRRGVVVRDRVEQPLVGAGRSPPRRSGCPSAVDG